jgi:hypothetical protein
MFSWLISHQPTVLFSQNKSATSNQPTVFFSQKKSAPAISHQPNEQAVSMKPCSQSQSVRLGGGWWLVLIYSERKVPVVGLF